MKRLSITVLFALFCIPSVFAQGVYYRSDVRTDAGPVAPGAQITVCTAVGTGIPCTPKATIYTDQNLTVQAANPVTANAHGNFSFYAAAGNYVFSVTGNGIVPQIFPVPIQSGGGGGSSVSVNGTPIASPNFQDNTNVTLGVAGSNIKMSLAGVGLLSGANTWTNTNTFNGSTTLAGGVNGNTTFNNNVTVSGSTTLAGGVTGNTTFNNNSYFKSGSPWFDPMAFGASGSSQQTTGSISSGTATLTIAAAMDFSNNQGVAVNGASAPAAQTVPTGLAVVAQGTTGSTNYQYQITCVNSSWAQTAATSAVPIANGNATLGYVNYNKVTWSADSGCVYYAVYGRVSGSMTPLGITSNLVWYDYGQANMNLPSTISSTPPGTAQAGVLYTTILSGGGTTTLTLAANAGTTVSGVSVRHDDSFAVQAAINAAASINPGYGSNEQGHIFFPNGAYSIGQTLIIPAGAGMRFTGETGRSATVLTADQYGMDLFQVNNGNESLLFDDIGFNAAASATILHFTNAAPALTRTMLDRTRVSASTASGAPSIFVRSDTNIVVFWVTHSTINADVAFQFGTPAAPVQIDDVRVRDSDIGMGVSTSTPGTFQFVSNGSSGPIQFDGVLLEGPFPNNNTTSLFWMGGGANPVLFISCNFADLVSGGVAGSPLFAAIPNLQKGLGIMTFVQSQLNNNNGSVFDWSGGTGNAPQIIIKDNGSNVSAGNSQQVWKTAADTSGGFTLQNANISPAQTLLSSNGNRVYIHSTPDVSQSAYMGFTGSPGQVGDPFRIDDSNGNPLFHVSPTGTATAAGITSTGTVDFTGSTISKLRVGAGLTGSANGDVGYDTTNKNWHAYGNGVDSIFGLFPASTSITSGHCTNWTVTAGVITLGDSGGTCAGGGGSSIFTSWQWGSNTALTSTALYIQVVCDSALFNMTQSGAGSAGSPYVDTCALKNQNGGTLFGNATGSSAAPTFTPTPVLGIPNSTAGTLGLANGSANATMTIQSFATSNFNFNGPINAGTSGYAFVSGGGGSNAGGWSSPSATIQGTSCTTLGGASCTIVNFLHNGLANSTNTGVDMRNSITNAIGISLTASNPSGNQEQYEATGTVNATGGGTGVSNPTAHSLLVTEGSSNMNLVTSPSVNGYYLCGFNVTSSAAVDPNCALSGVPVLTPATPYSMAYSDRATFQMLTGGSTFSFTLCQIIGNCASNLPLNFWNGNSGNLTITANAADKINGGSTGGTHVVLPNWFEFLRQDSSSAPGNWWAFDFPEYRAFPACGANCALNFSTVTGIGTTTSIVTGPGSSTSTDLASFNGTGGLTLQDSGILTANVLTSTSTQTSGALMVGAGNKTAGSPLDVSGADYVVTSTAAHTWAAEQVNSGSNCGDSTHAVSYSTSTHLFGCQAISATGTPCTTTALSFQYNNAGSFGCVADVTLSGSHTVLFGASGILDLSAVSVTAGLKLPSAAGAAPTADSFDAFNTTTHARVWGSNGTTIVGAAAATGTNASTTCTNQFVTVISAVAAPTCTTGTSAYVDSSVVTDSGNTTTTAAKVAISTTTAGKINYIDFPATYFIPAANCNNATGGAGWSIGSGGTVTCRAGTNNLGGYISITDTSSTFATFQVEIPEDWDTSSNPYIRFQVASQDATNGHTIIPSIQVACYKGDGSTTDDVAANATHSSSTITLNGNANRFWSNSNVQMNSTDVTGCVAGALMQITVGRATDTATGTGSGEFYGATVTFPRLIAVQAN